jgi:hypothetical protein
MRAGEAAVASAAAAGSAGQHHKQQHAHQLTPADADKVLALGARITASMTPFVAAAAQRSSEDGLFVLTSRLQQLMLDAARLAGRRGVAAAREMQSGPLGAAAGANGAPLVSADDLGCTASLHHVGQVLGTGSSSQGSGGGGSAKQQQQQRVRGDPAASLQEMQGKLRSGMSRLAARQAASHQAQGLRQRSTAAHDQAPRWQQQYQATLVGGSKHHQLTHAHQHQHHHATSEHVQHGAPSVFWGHAASGAGPLPQSEAGPVLLDSGCGLGEDLPRQLLLADAEPVGVPAEDMVHPWAWDVTQPLTTLSGGVKVG